MEKQSFGAGSTGMIGRLIITESDKEVHLIQIKSPGIGFVNVTFPIPGFASVVGFAALRLPGDGTDLPPGAALGAVQLALFLLGQLLIGNKLFHFKFLHFRLQLSYQKSVEVSNESAI